MESHDKKVGQIVHNVKYMHMVPENEPETVFVVVKNTTLDMTTEVNKQWLNEQAQILSSRMFKRAVKQKARQASNERLEVHLKAKIKRNEA